MTDKVPTSMAIGFAIAPEGADPPCLNNGGLSEAVYNGEGWLIGWKRKEVKGERNKRTKV